MDSIKLQQNRFCGIILKNKRLVPQIPRIFREVTSDYYVLSAYDRVLDGYRSGTLGGWAEAELEGRHLKLSRDRIGVRAIYYMDTPDYFCFSNTIHQLKVLPFLTLEPDPKGILNFLIHGRTINMIKELNELPLGSTLTYNIDKNSYRIREAVPVRHQEIVHSEIEAIHETKRLIQASVKRTLDLCGESAGSFLSGGIDSSVLASGVKSSDRSIPYITAMTGHALIDEVPFASEVVKALSLEQWHQVLVGNIDKELENLHVAMELPTTSMGSFMQYELMRFCGHLGINHVLDGTGADALFAGHNYYHAIYWNSLLRAGKMKRLRRETKAFYLDTHWFKYYSKNMLLYYYIPRFSRASKLRFHLKNTPLLNALNPDFIYGNLEVLDTKPEFKLKNLNVFLANDFYGGSVSELLRFTDRLGKYFGVQSHSVFAEDPELYRFALSIPSSYKIKQGYTKSILRNAFSDTLPSSVLERKKKMGLVAPNNLWMKQYKELVLSFINESMSEFYNVEKMQLALENAIDNADQQENYKIFKFISLAIWHKTMFDD